MRIYITGAKGQLGRALMRRLAHHTLLGIDLPEVDLTDLNAIRSSIAAFEPDVVIHAAAMTDVDVTQQFIRELKQMGCRFALDDFGAGFSSFYYLKRFDVDYVKIDGSFIRDLATDEGNRIFVKAVCDIAKGLNKQVQVIAEWIEDREVMKILTEMDTVVYGQGFLFHRPAPLWEQDTDKLALAGGE